MLIYHNQIQTSLFHVLIRYRPNMNNSYSELQVKLPPTITKTQVNNEGIFVKEMMHYYCYLCLCVKYEYLSE